MPAATGAAHVSPASRTSFAAWGDHVLIAWNDAASPSRIGHAFSTNGGATFTEGGAPPAAPGWEWSGGTIVAVDGRTGTFHLCGLVDASEGRIGVVSARLSRSAIAWGPPVAARTVDARRATLGEPWLVADSTSGHLYLMYTVGRRSGGRIEFQRSTDGGRTWSAAVALSAPAEDGRVRAPRAAVGPSGELYATWSVIGRGREERLRVRRSPDRGASWSAPVTAVAGDAPADSAGIADAAQGGLFHSITVDRTDGPDRGRVHLAWTRGGTGNVFAAHSDDGATWSAPVSVHTATGRHDLRPEVAVAADGMPYVAWFDARDDRGDASLPRLARSESGGDRWSPARPPGDLPAAWVATPGSPVDSTSGFGHLSADGSELRLAWSAGRGGVRGVSNTRVETRFDLTACQGDLAADPGSALNPGWVVSNRNPLFANAYGWTLASGRDWPMVPVGAIAAAAGRTGTVGPAIAIPDTAAPGVNRVCVTVTDPKAIRGRPCCFDITIQPAAASLPILASAFDLRTSPAGPASNLTRVDYSIPHAGTVRLSIHGLGGELVRTLTDGVRPAGPSSVTWDGRNERGGRAGAGAYFCRLEGFGNVRVQRLIWVR